MSVRQRGTDSSGRPIYASDYLWALWLRILADPAVAPFAHKLTVVQGAWMSLVAGGGAEDSEGFHDRGGCFDVRTWNLTAADLEAFIRTARRYGFPFWRRDDEHGGMDPHAHGVCGTDADLAAGAAAQWRAYLAGFDGLASNGPDYEWRPSPLVTTPPPEDDMTPDQDARLARLEQKVDDLLDAAADEKQRDRASWKREQRIQALAAKNGKTADQILDELEAKP